MRIALKSTLALLSLYLALLAGLAFLIESELRASVRQLMDETAALVGGEVAAALHEPGIKQLLGKKLPGRQDMTRLIASTKQRSDTLLSIELVDTRGKVIAGDDARTIGEPRQPPDMVFRNGLEPVVISSFERRFRDGEHLLLTPLTRQDRLLGYLSIALTDGAITALYGHVYSALLLTALAGLAAIVALGVLLQLQLRRVSTGLTALVDAIATGETELPPGTDGDFAGVRDAAGRLGNALSAARGQATLAQSKLNAVANIFDVGIVLLGADGAPEYVNQTAKQILVGDRPEDFEVRFAEIRGQLDEAVASLCRTAGIAHVSYIDVTDGAGAVKRLRVEVHALGAPDAKGCLLIIKDRDLIDALDEDLRAATRSRSLSRLYAAAAHDLKAPLNAMNLHLEMLKRVLERDDASRGAGLHYVDVLHLELARLNRLLHSVLEHGAPTNGGREVIDLKELIVELETLLQPQARHQRVTLAVDVPSRPVPIFGNAGQLKQALLNITLNALECVAEGGRVEIKLATEVSTALVRICDDGPGISANLQTSIFDMHFTTKQTGTGIGLYVAREVMKGHGGEIRVESKLGAGSCFTISLPLHRASPPGDAPLHSAGEIT